jgi:hypothetical protein
MNTFVAPEKAIRRIFETQYITDELGHDWIEDIPQMAKISAQSLYLSVGKNQAKKTCDFLQEMRNNYEHPLVLDAELSVWVDWEDEPEEWANFQMLLDEIIKQLSLMINARD